MNRLHHCAWLITLLLAPVAATAQDAAVAARAGGTPELMRALHDGGYVVYFRHGHTQWQQKILEQAMQAEGRHDLANCATQRNLDAIGRADAQRIGAALQPARIPIGEVLASLYCRPAEYVQIITGKAPQRVRWLTGLSTPETLREIKRAVATPPAPGTNTVLGGHGDRPFELTGLVIQEGDALVFDPRRHRGDDPGTFAPLAWIKPREWAALVPAGAAPPAAPAAPLRPPIVAAITWPSSDHHDADNLRASLPTLGSGAAVDDAALARALALVRENPSKNLEVAFAPAASPDGVQARLALADVKPWRLGAGIDQASAHGDGAGAGHDRLWLSATHANLWQRDHQLSVRWARVARSGHDTWSGAYRAPLPAFDTLLGAVLTRADDGAGLDADGEPITGAARTLRVFARRHLSPRDDYHHHLQLSLADHDWFARDGAPAVRSRPLALGYRGHWEEEWIGWHLGVEGVSNLPGGRRNDAASIGNATGDASATRRWHALRADGEWLRILTYDIRLRLAARAQWADRALVPGERLALGGTLAPWGSAFGVWRREPWLHRAALRGLPERALAGDDGAVVSAELWSRRLAGHDLRIGGFVDAGEVRRRVASAGSGDRDTATSGGVVAHWQWRGQLAAAFSAARLLNGGGGYRRGAQRVELTLAGSY